MSGELLHVHQFRNVEAVAVVDGAGGIADRNDARAGLMQQLCRNRSGIAEALHRNGCAFQRDVEMLACALNGVETAAAGGFVAAQRSAQADRLAGDDAGNGVALGHAVGVHDPGHGLRIGVDIGRGNVLLRADERKDRAGVAARHPLKFALRHVFRIAGDAALAAAERDVHDRALPGHPGGQRLHFVERDLRMEANAALCRAARRAVLHAIGFESGGCGRRPCAPARLRSARARET